MKGRVEIGGLQIATVLHDFIADEVLPGTGVANETFWCGFAALVHDLAPRNQHLLAQRDFLQARIDGFHRTKERHDPLAYEAFLRKIGYLLPEPADVTIRTTNVDDEIAHLAGPQLVVPASNARYVLNAAGARWGSLYDALYGTDAIPRDGATPARGYDKDRGAHVIARVRALLDDTVALAQGSHGNAVSYAIEDGRLVAALRDGTRTALARPDLLVGYDGAPEAPSAVLLRHHGLHLELRIDRTSRIGRDDPAGIADVIVEAALTTIVDLEDSVAAVDAADKVVLYRNWLGLMRGTLTARFEKDGRSVERRLAADRHYRTPDGGTLRLPGRSLMLVRNVGLHM
jgi:malate synthase